MKRITTLTFLLLSVIAEAEELPKNEVYFGSQFLFSSTTKTTFAYRIGDSGLLGLFYPRLRYDGRKRLNFKRFNIGYNRQIQLRYFEVIVGGNLQYTNFSTKDTIYHEIYVGKDIDPVTGNYWPQTEWQRFEYTWTRNIIELQSTFGLTKTLRIKKFLIRPELLNKIWKLGYSKTIADKKPDGYAEDKTEIGGYSFLSYDIGITLGVGLWKKTFLTVRGSCSAEYFPQYFKYPKPEVYGFRLGFCF